MSNPTLQAIEERQKRKDECLVEDEAQSKKNWKKEFGNLTGHATAWKAKFIKRTVKAKNSNEHERPKILDNKENKRIPAPPAYSLARVEGGWCVITYQIDDRFCSIIGQTKPEGKHFAVSRLQQMIMEQIQ